jgi:hypothetical protein
LRPVLAHAHPAAGAVKDRSGGRGVGRVSERHDRRLIVYRRQHVQARRALAVLTVAAGFAVWALVAILIIIMIFRIFTEMYLKPINDALNY